MRIEWLVAKHVPDPLRREPKNIGVVLRVNGQFLWQFLGQREDGAIDGRRLRSFSGTTPYFKAWVDAWVRQLRDWQSDSLDGLLAHRANDAYYLEYGGQRLVGTEDTDPTRLLEDLYRRIVAPPLTKQAGEEKPDLRTLAERVLRRAGIARRVQRGFVHRIQEDGKLVDSVRFHYAYDGNGRNGNGTVTLMQRVPVGIGDDEQDSWAAVHNAAWSFSKVADSPVAGNQRAIALVRMVQETEEVLSQVNLLSKYASVINVIEEVRAARDLQDAMASPCGQTITGL